MPDTSAQILELHSQSQRLLEQERYAEAAEVGQRLCELAAQHLGQDDGQYAIYLQHLASIYVAQREFARAVPLFQQAIATCRTAFGENHEDFLNSLIALAGLYGHMNDFEKSEPVLSQAVEISRVVLGERDPDHAMLLTFLAITYRHLGQHARAAPLLRKALEINRQAVAEDDPQLLGSLINLADLCLAMSEYPEAEALYQEALEVCRRGGGITHPQFRMCVGKLASVYTAMGDDAKAEAVYEQALRSSHAALAKTFPLSAPPLEPTTPDRFAGLGKRLTSIDTMLPDIRAFFACRQAFAEGDYSKCVELASELLKYGAETDIIQALVISLQRLNRNNELDEILPQLLAGTQHDPWENFLLRLTTAQADPDQAVSSAQDDNQRCQAHYYAGARLVTLGKLDAAQLEFCKCLETGADCFERRLAEQEAARYQAAGNVQGNRAHETKILQLIGNVTQLFQQGRYHEALEPASSAVDTARELLGDDHTYYADALINLGAVHRALGAYREAEQAFCHARDAKRTAHGETHPGYAQALNGLAGVYESMGSFDQAEPLYRQALEIRRATLGDRHPDFGTILNNLAANLMQQGKTDEAEPLFEQAVEVRRAALGEDNPEFASSLFNLAHVQMSRNKYHEAKPLLERVVQIVRSTLGEGHPYFRHSQNALADVCRRLDEGEEIRRAASSDLTPPPSQVRVFVSSTFRDMQSERDELVKNVFPRLRQLCEQWGVRFHWIDLRWGITEEAAAEGKVLPICLAEIDKCRPYFIGILGDRYGWVPDDVTAKLLEQYPWLADHRERSVTELEILHGVLNHPDPKSDGSFYFRSPDARSDERPGAQQPDLPDSPQDAGKLAALKQRIRTCGATVRENYRSAQELGLWILRDLTEMLNRRFPAQQRLEPLDREAREHDRLAARLSPAYVERRDWLERLDAHAQSDGSPLVVVGSEGMGKSALLANWVHRYRDRHPDDLVLLHLVGATPGSTDAAQLLRRLAGEVKRRLSLHDANDLKGTPDDLYWTESCWLYFSNAAMRCRRRIVIVIDGLTHLEDHDGALDLAWVHANFLENVSVVFSTRPGRPLDAASRQRWPTLELSPLETADRERLISTYLATHSKSLGADRVQRIAAANACGNPLLLRTILDQLRVFGSHEQLDEQIDHYLTAESLDELFEGVITRCQQDYETDRPGLVGDALKLLCTARRGLSEIELLDLLGSNGLPLPQHVWSGFQLAIETQMADSDGTLRLLHDSFQRAARRKFLVSDTEQRAAHNQLAEYFAGRDVDARAIEEMLWHLARSQSWDRLYARLADPKFFAAAWDHDASDVKRYWTQIEANTPLRMVDAYQPVLRQREQHVEVACRLAILLDQKGYCAEALPLRELLVRHYRQSGDQDALQGALGGLAGLYDQLGRLDEALELYEEQAQLCHESQNLVGLQAAAGNQALVFKRRGQLREALQRLKLQESIGRAGAFTEALHRSLGHQAEILESLGDLHGALEKYREKEQLCRRCGEQLSLARAIGGQARVQLGLGKLNEASELIAQAKTTFQELGSQRDIATCCDIAGEIACHSGNVAEGMSAFQQSELIRRRMSDPEGVAKSLGNQAVALLGMKQPQEAVAKLAEVEDMFRKLEDPESLTRCLVNEAVILLRHLDLPAEARQKAEEAHQIAEACGYAAMSAASRELLNMLRA